MSTIIRTRLVEIGDTQGVRIPKAMLDHLGITDMVELEVRDDHLRVRAFLPPRHNWRARFQQMAAHGDDKLLDDDVATTWDSAEWNW